MLRLMMLISICLLTSCGESKSVVVSQIRERDANAIVVFLHNNGIRAYKQPISSSTAVGGTITEPMFNVSVDSDRSVMAMSLLHTNGLPRQLGVTLIDLFPKAGLMSSEREENIRYQSGLTSQVNNMILMIDGVIESRLQVSFPSSDTNADEKITASVFVKHQGVLDDPNTHLEIKIKKIVSGSIHGLDVNDVTVVSDRSRFSVGNEHSEPSEFVRIWSMTMDRSSTLRFRVIFFSLMTFLVVFILTSLWLMWKTYPVILSKGGFRELFRLRSILPEKNE